MRYPKLRELKEAVRSLFSRPYTTKFPKEAHIPVSAFKGAPEFHKDDCVGCGACAEVCPAATIYVKDDLKTRMRNITLRLDSCLFCGNCQANCITQKGIMLGNKYDLATYKREESITSVDKEIIVCEHCECVIGAKDHIRFLVKKLGVLAYGNPTLILASQDTLRLSETNLDSKAPAVDASGRPGMFKILCPRCRRESMLTDEYGK